jgi:hypothetical protein
VPQTETLRPLQCSRSRAGFTLNIIDTPGLVEGGGVNDQALEIIRRYFLFCCWVLSRVFVLSILGLFAFQLYPAVCDLCNLSRANLFMELGSMQCRSRCRIILEGSLFDKMHSEWNFSRHSRIWIPCCFCLDGCRFLLNKTIDAVLYVDRLDGYRVDNLDRQVIRAIHRSFGPRIWRLAIVALTHAQLSPPDGVEYSEFLQRRSEGLQAAIRQEAGFKKNEDPVSLLWHISTRAFTSEL